MRSTFRQHPYLGGLAVCAALAFVGCVLVARSPQSFAGAFLQSITVDRRIEPLHPGTLRWVSWTFAGLAVFFAAALTMVVVWRDRLRPRMAAARDPETGDREGTSFTRADLLMLVGAIIGGTLFRSGFLTQPVGFDEAITYVFFASRGFIDALSDYAIPNNHILHTLLMHAVHSAGGRSAALLRLPALLAGISAIPAACWLAQRLFRSNTVAVFTAWLVAVAPPMVEYSAQARGYTLGTLLFLLAFVAATYIPKRGGWLPWTALVILSALSLLTIPTMLLGVGIPWLWLLFAAEKDQRAPMALKLTLATVATALLTLLLYAPVIIRSGLDSLTSNSYVTPMAISGLPHAVYTTGTRTTACWTGSLPWYASIGIGVLALLPLIGPRELRSRAARIAAAALLCLCFFIVWRRVAPPPRTIHFLYPLFAAFVACGIHAVAGRWLHSRRWQYVAIIAFSAVWAASRISAGGFGWQRESPPRDPRVRGPFAANACAEGYYVDAAAIVDRFEDEIKGGALLVAYVYSGAVETVQFELVRRGLSPVRARPVRDRDTLARVADARDVLVLIMPIAGGPDLRTPYDLLHTDSATLTRRFSAPELVATFAVTNVFRMRQLDPPDTLRLRPVLTYPR